MPKAISRDILLRALETAGIKPDGPARARVHKRVRSAVSATGAIILAAGVSISLNSSWTFEYEKGSQRLISAELRQEEVVSRGDSTVEITPIVAFTVLTATGSNSWPVPADWDNANNVVDCIGCGASGAAGTNGNGASGRGGGGGAFARRSNVALTPGGSASYSIAAANSGGNTWFDSTSTVLADGASAQTGGQAGSSVGDLTRTGGNGGNGATRTGSSGNLGGCSAGAGGGAAGQNSNGSAGQSGATNSGATGGAARTGGASGGGAGAGAAGSEYDGNYGAGGGASSPAGRPGGATTAGFAGVAGGFYGGGGSGGGGGGATGIGGTAGSGGALGAGRQGMIAIAYVPFVPAGTHRMFAVF